NRVVLSGVVQSGDDPTFRVELDGRLRAGIYTMFAVIALSGNVMNADIRRIPFVVTSVR
ncbi:MAG: hypothetical protein HW392_2065, partial [Steroidobacteraceae bacterium]|nr:hypothetical protein [Steroidobacteraceae bacterium]